MINNLQYFTAAAFADMSIFNKCGTIILYTTLILLALIAMIGLLIRFFQKNKITDYFKYSLGIGVGYSIAVIVLMLFLKFNELKQSGDFTKEVFYPLMAILIVCGVIAIGGLILSILQPKKMKAYWTISGITFIAALISVIVLLAKYYNKTIKPSGGYQNVSTLWLSVGAGALMAILILLCLLFGKKEAKENHTKSIVYAAICIALSFALSYLRLFRLPQGGSITLVSLLPLMLYSYMFGIRKAVLAGVIYGILQAIQDPWIIHPMQFLLDYPLAFGMIGVSGMFKKLGKKPYFPFILGGILSGILRYLSHVISGIFAFSSFAAQGYSAIAWGFLYNSFALADIAIAIVVGTLLFANKAFFKQITTSN